MANKKRKKNENFFNSKKFGEEIQKRRRKAGYKNVDSFSEAIQEKTGSDISPEMISSIEQGRTRISIEDLMAVCWTLYKYEWNEQIADLIDEAMFSNFKYKIAKEKYKDYLESPTLEKKMAYNHEAVSYAKGNFKASGARTTYNSSTGEIEIKPVYVNKSKTCPKCGEKIYFPENYSLPKITCKCGKKVELERSDFA